MDSILERIDNNYKEIKKFWPFEDKNLLKQIRDFYRVEVTWSSNAIEGSSYTLSETKVLLEDGLTAGGKPLSHALAAKSHAEAWNYMFSLLQERFLSENRCLFSRPSASLPFRPGGEKRSAGSSPRSCLDKSYNSCDFPLAEDAPCFFPMASRS